MTIIDLAQAKLDRTPHCQGPAFCMGCNHEWIGVWPAGKVDLECPNCHAHRGRGKFNITPPATELVTCNKCGNQLFNLMPDGFFCPGCGMRFSYEGLI